MTHIPKIYVPEFFIGQQLVCINRDAWITEDEMYDEIGPVFMEIVTVDYIVASGVFLKEYKSLYNEPYHFDCFVPLSVINSRIIITEKNLSKK